MNAAPVAGADGVTILSPAGPRGPAALPVEPHRIDCRPHCVQPGEGPPVDPVDAATVRRITQRHDGWTADRRRAFLEMIADGVSAAAACRHVGLSESSAYALRRRADGAEFAIGWQAASLIARDRMAEMLTDRALEGYEETVTRADGTTTSRFRYDNRLALAMLTRLDRYADQAEGTGGMRAARLVAQEFDGFLDLIERGDGPARAGLFLARRAVADMAEPDLSTIAALARADRYVRTGAGVPQEIDIADLDPAARAEWTAEQWQRAEAAGLLALAPAAAPEPADAEHAHTTEHPQLNDADPADFEDDEEEDEEEEDERVWFCDFDKRWHTSFPPPPGYSGEEEGSYGDELYERELSAEEVETVEIAQRHRMSLRLAHDGARRAAWFAAQLAEVAADAPAPPVPAGDPRSSDPA